MKIFLIILPLICFSSCVPSKKADVTPFRFEEYNRKIKEADILYKRGSYSCLEEALQIYQNLLAFPAYQRETRDKYLKTALLLALRENELAILGDEYLEKASDLIQKFPYISEYYPYLEVVQTTSRKIKGFAYKFSRDKSSTDSYLEWIRKDVNPLNIQLKRKSESEDFFAYFYISFYSEYTNFIEEKDDLLRFLKIFPESPLLQYKLAIYQKVNQISLEELIRKEPRFQEANYFLGEIFLMLGQIISAEKNFLMAYKHIPKSTLIIISLTKTYFVLEEFENCLKFNEEALQLFPEYRDALLGKAICLSYLGRSEEAIEVLNRLIQLGKYLMGETHYWLAWNQNEIEKYEEAWKTIEKTKNYIFGSHEVYSLAGIIAFNRGSLEEAERNFKEALRLNSSNCEASFHLGKIYSMREDWNNSGIYFEKAALCNLASEHNLEEKIKEIKNSLLAEERKKQHILRKKVQLRNTSMRKATSYYNAAACYYNVGMKEKALDLAYKAVLHDAFKEKAEELINKIKEVN